MRVLLTLTLLVAVSASILDQPVLKYEEVELINQLQHQWKAGFNDNFRTWTVEQTMKIMGAQKDETKLPSLAYPRQTLESLPTSFDARQEWPACIGPILNQARCGSCWAFGAAEAISDRKCLSSPNSTYLALAPLDLVTCDAGMFGNAGCQGGQLGLAWQYVQQYGLVTEQCAPYGTWEKPHSGPIPTCTPQEQPCEPPTFVNTPPCNKTCATGGDWETDKHKISSVYSVQGVDNIAAEIMKNGPVEGAFSVYSDFVHYKSGVYSHTTGSLLGGHAIKIIGWGVEQGVDYWLVQNSWTTTWGSGGYFKIKRGVDECGIEGNIVAGTV